MKYLLAFLLIISISTVSKAGTSLHLTVSDSMGDTIACSPEIIEQVEKNGEVSIWKMYTPAPVKSISSVESKPGKNDDIKAKQQRRKKIIACALAFPLPLGIIGVHRIYLKTKPYVPVVYIVTLGGAAGIVPFIDFIVLLLEKDISKYENNPNIIMWAK